MSLSDTLFKDRHGKKVIWQTPNWPIIVSLAGYALDRLIADDLSIFGELFLAYWALLEIFLGVNLFRRLLGAGAIIFLLVQFL